MLTISTPRALVCVLIGLALWLAATLPGCQQSPSDADIVYLDDERFATIITEPPVGTLIIDARSPSDFEAGTVPGAINVQLREVPVEEVRERFGGYNRIIVFGPHPGSPRAAALSKRLLAGGVSVQTYLPGYERWLELREEKPAAEAP
ncbi:MAG: rhodanese-like domain-containing protein [Phycisphaerales bacterium JB038]